MKKLIFALGMLIIGLSNNSLQAQWVQKNGPYGALITEFAVSGSNLFSATWGGGVFLSTNNGTSWNSVNSGLTNTFIHCLLLNGSSLFAGTEGGGVFLSTNNGTSWIALNTGLTDLYVSGLAINGSNLFAATESGVFLSTNNGTSWTAVNTGLTTSLVSTLTFYGSTLLAGTRGGGVFRSENNGVSWTQSGIPNGEVEAFAVIGSNIFAATANQGIFLSTNNGASWIAINSGLTDLSFRCLAVKGTSLYCGTYMGGVFVSTNNGTSWTAANTGLTNTTVHALAVSGNNLFAGTRGSGVFLSTNNGSSWSAVNTNLVYNAYIRALASSETDIFAVTRGCIFQSVDNGANWISRNKGLYYYDNYSIVKKDNDIFTGTFNGIVLRSSDNGASWTYAGTGLTDAIVWTLGVNGSNLFAGTYGGGVFLSSNNGANWTAVNSGLSDLTVTSLVVSGNNLYAGTYGGGVFLSTNNGTTWTAISNTGLTNKNIRALAVQGTNLIAGTQDAGVFLYSNSTSSWSPINSGLTNLNIRSFVVYGNNLLVGTGSGVYLSKNSGTSWSQVSPELTNKSVMSLAISGSNLYAGTWGYGVWQRPMSEMITSGETQTVWSLQNNPLPNNNLLGKIQFVSSTEGWISASDGKLLHTTNAGSTWNIVSSSQNDVVSSMADPSFTMNWVNQTHGWKMNWLGTNFDDANGAVLLKTIDGGNTWTKKELPKTISTVTYSTADLQGTWQWHELVSANKKTLPSSWIGWGHGIMTVDGNGNGVFSGVVKSDGRPHVGSSVSMSITSRGVITEGGESHGYLSADKKTIYLTTNDKRGGYILGVGQKIIPATTYSMADLQGTWQMHVLSAGDSIMGRYSGWGYGKMTCDMNGNITGNGMGPDNGQFNMSFSASISSAGVITGFGPSNLGNHGFMSADKKSYFLTMTGGGGNTDYNLVVFQKQVSGTTYSAKDLQGRWQMHALTTSTTNNSNSESNWMHEQGTADATGNASFSNLVVNGHSKSDNNRNFTITSDGILSMAGSPDSHGYMSNDKNSTYMTYTDESGGYVLFFGQKDLSVSGDIGAQIQFVDENNGWASVGNPQIRTGALYKTTDGGSNWSLINSLPATDETAFFYFADANNGWMTSINDNPPLFQISKTNNGGSTWTAQYTDTTPNANTLSSSGAMQFTDANNGWVVGPNGRVLKTTNGGTNWELLNNTGLSVYANSKCLFFLDANNGWIGTNISNPGSATQHIILHTNNGGQSWAKQSVPFTGAVFSIFFKDANEGWFTGEQCVQNCNMPDDQKVFTGVIGHTTNGGATIIEESLANKQIIIYPNPSKNTLFISGLNLNSAAAIFDLSGKQLINKQIVNNQIDVSQLINGIYILRISDKDGITMKKFIKQ